MEEEKGENKKKNILWLHGYAHNNSKLCFSILAGREVGMKSRPGVEEKPFVKLLVNKGSELVNRVTASTCSNLSWHNLVCMSLGCVWMKENLKTRQERANVHK